jgi:lysine/ornithine N-monooxygenase
MTGRAGRVGLRVEDTTGATSEVVTDHVIVGTGYRVDLHAIPFLRADLASAVRSAAGAPVLSSSGPDRIVQSAEPPQQPSS